MSKIFRYYGWIAINYHTHDINLELQDRAIERLNKYLKDIKLKKDTYILSRINGLDSFMVMGLDNHKNNQIIELFNWVAENIEGSYGLLYIHDDEDFSGSYKQTYFYGDQRIDNSNKFVVWKIARGKLIREEDPFLSPCIPIIEDPYDPMRED